MGRPDQRLQVARILGPHGVKGRVRLEVRLETPDLLQELAGLTDEAGRAVALKLEGTAGKAFIARIAGVDSREAAEALARTVLYAPRAALPAPEADEYYEADLQGLTVAEEAGPVLGQVAAVVDFGAGPLIEVRPEAGGSTVFLPFTAAVVTKVDLAEGRLLVALMPGLWPGR